MIRKAKVQDIQAIKKLIEPYGKNGVMLPVSLAELYDRLRSFFLYEDEAGAIVGVAALHVTWDDLAEIRSLAVGKEHKKQGIGRRLVESCMGEAKALGVGRVFVLTYIPEFFTQGRVCRVRQGQAPAQGLVGMPQVHEVPGMRRDGDAQEDRVKVVSKSSDGYIHIGSHRSAAGGLSYCMAGRRA